MISRFSPIQIYRLGGIFLLHLVVIVALITGTQYQDWLVFAVVYPLAAIGVGISMHRYFAHRAFKTSRFFQFFLALTASLSFGNAVNFAGKHRLHHRHSDREADVHSPRQGVWQCWVGSIVDCGYPDEDIDKEIEDYRAFPELMWLYKHSTWPGLALCATLFAIGGFSMFAIGGCLSSVLLLHQSSAVNYFCHCRGSRRFATRDDSRNNPLVAFLTYGEGWHNNHHRFPRSARAGIYWWEVDLFYSIICLFEVTGLVWDVERVPRSRLSTAQLASD